MAKGYREKSAKGKGTWGEVQRKSGISSQEFSLHGGKQDTFLQR